MSGSSPLTRGKLAWCKRLHTCLRLIPAHAGKTDAARTCQEPVGAHPRSRGENGSAASIISVRSGSSPLTRGKLGCPLRTDQGQRLIPAHAGKTRSADVAEPKAPAHPRSRGENPSADCTEPNALGSSPLTRGKQGIGLDEVTPKRLIPAHAGKTRRGTTVRDRIRAHPRSRGENPSQTVVFQAAKGSSPLTRGKHLAADPLPDRRGLIPAHAGKTHGCYRAASAHAAHPRSRGENFGPSLLGCSRPGSSPLTRGKHPAQWRGHRPQRLIPAHAGKTSLRSPTIR